MKVTQHIIEQIADAVPGTLLKVSNHASDSGVKDYVVQILSKEQYAERVKGSIRILAEFLKDPVKFTALGDYPLSLDFVRKRFIGIAQQKPYSLYRDLWGAPIPEKESKRAYTPPEEERLAFHLSRRVGAEGCYLQNVLRVSCEILTAGKTPPKVNTDIQKFNFILSRIETPLSNMITRLDISKADHVEILPSEL